MSFGENLINLRRQKGWSQDDLANNLNISRQAISKWENNTSKPDVDNIEKISKIFSVKIDELLNNELPNDKAVALDVKKEEKKEKTITIVKLMIIAVIILYAISVIYKFASLLVIVNGVQKYANLNNYHYVITTYDENGLAEKEECWFKDGISKTVSKTADGLNITCIDYPKNEGYTKLSDDGEETSINMEDYNYAHKNYKNGGQLVDSFPKVLSEQSILDILIKIINADVDINICSNGIIFKTKEEYISMDKEKLLPISLYSSSNREAKGYLIEINSVSDIEI